MAPPMPPLAPVTRAFLPLRSNNPRPSPRLRSGKLRHGRGDVVRRADVDRLGAVGNAPGETRQYLAGADFGEHRHAGGGEPRNRLAPADHAGDLLDEAAP